MEDNNFNLVHVLLGAIVLGGIGYLLYKKSKNSNAHSSRNTDEQEYQMRYSRTKTKIELAIQDKDWARLERMLDTKIQEFPDLIQMIQDALKNKPS